MTNVLEILAILVLLAFALMAPRIGRRARLRTTRRLRRLANHRVLALGTLTALSLAISMSIGGLIKIPDPAVHDEFAYLLAADTFASGRLTNPPHPLAEFFQTYQVLQHPTYQAKYPPGQGLLLAIGQRLFGLPIVGAWLGLAAAVAATGWMLQGWMPPRWAMLGGFLATLSYSLLTSWGQSYWGGTVAMCGGALAYGALPRIVLDRRTRDSLWLGIGLGLLSISRPYEGLIASLPIALVLASQEIREWSRVAWQHRLRWILPVSITLAITGCFITYYNYRVTGNPWRLPYQVWHAQLAGDPLLVHTIFGSIVRTDYAGDKERTLTDRLWSWKSPASLSRKIIRQWAFYICPALIPAVFMVPCVLKHRTARFMLISFALVFVMVLLQGTAGHPHYLAPVVPLLFGILVWGYRRLGVWHWQGRRSGQFLLYGLVFIYAAATCLAIISEWRIRPYPGGHAWSLERARIAQALTFREGQHLAIVRYMPNHVVHFEWVYNRAEIDRAKIIWSHDLGPDRNQALLSYYPDRTVWLVEADQKPARMRRYSNE